MCLRATKVVARILSLGQYGDEILHLQEIRIHLSVKEIYGSRKQKKKTFFFLLLSFWNFSFSSTISLVTWGAGKNLNGIRPGNDVGSPSFYAKVVSICPLGVSTDSSPVRNNTDKNFRVHWMHFSRDLTWKQGLWKFLAPYQVSFLCQVTLVCLWLLRPLSTTSLKYFYDDSFFFILCARFWE